MGPLTLITCTGDRPDAFALCEKYVARQTRPPTRWIVVDDGAAPTPTTMGQEVIRLPPDPTRHTLPRNMLAALDRLGPDYAGAVAIVEDDDWYAPWWLDRVAHELARPAPVAPLPGSLVGVTVALPDIVGEAAAVYYHVPTRRSFRHQNYGHASLSMTAFRHTAIAAVRLACEQADHPEWGGAHLTDYRIWTAGDASTPWHAGRDLVRRLWLCDCGARPGVVGIKGLPGRAGIGGGHRGEEAWGWADDRDGRLLRALTGDDAGPYLSMHTLVSDLPPGWVPLAG